MNNLLKVQATGHKLWLDGFSRELVNSDILPQLIKQDGIAGMTSNPNIIYEAIKNDVLYKTDLHNLQSSHLTLEERYEQLIITDIKKACDIFLDLYTQSNYVDGYVSFELSPHLAHDTDKTVSKARTLWKLINRPNLMIKIPGTTAGIKACEILTAQAININVTLLFSVTQLINTWRAYINGLQNLHEQGKSVKQVKSVASLFISRTDNALNEHLPIDLQGKVAISIAKVAYNAYTEIFHNNVFSQLAKAGANPQFLLFASTVNNNTNISKLIYLESLIGPESIHTVPLHQLNEFKLNGNIQSSLTYNLTESKQILEQVKQYIDLTTFGQNLQDVGLKLFTTSFDNILELMH